jgi:hypothetical protein
LKYSNWSHFQLEYDHNSCCVLIVLEVLELKREERKMLM